MADQYIARIRKLLDAPVSSSEFEPLDLFPEPIFVSDLRVEDQELIDQVKQTQGLFD
jgi:hypothetical protein